MAHGDAWVGEVKGKHANGVGSQYPSHHRGTWLSSITTADAHTSAASSRLNWRPRQFKWTRPFRRKTKYGLCACAITFQLTSNTLKEKTRQEMYSYVKRNIGARSRKPLLPRASNKCDMSSVFLLCYPAFNAHAPFYIVFCGLSGFTLVFNVCHKQHDFRGGIIEHKMCV